MPRALVTGGAGFVGSHLCDRLLEEGWDVVCADELSTGIEGNLHDAKGRHGFEFVRADISETIPVEGPLDAVLHLASPASPRAYLSRPIETLLVGSAGTHRALRLAEERRATFLLASTSEVYGDPLVHPQPETYWGNVNPVGPRSVYDEAKRFGEALAFAFHRSKGVPIKVARIFNTFGPRMRRDDGRAVPTFVDQALHARPITVHGDGRQTRSLCWVDDLIEGIWRLLGSDHVGPMNLGNPDEVKVLELAHQISALVGSPSEIVFTDRPVDDPEVRCPDISLARAVLGWAPRVSLREGLERTIAWADQAWRRDDPRRHE